VRILLNTINLWVLQTPIPADTTKPSLGFLNEVQKFLDKKNYKSIAHAYKNIINSNLVNRQYPLTFYSEQLLFSSEARKKLLMPDLAVPFTINSRFLIRGDIIESKKEE